MEHSQFDKFIRANAEKELAVPSELDWDNMTIPLPEQKRKRRLLPFWLLFIMFLGGLGIGSFKYLQQTEVAISSFSIPTAGLPQSTVAKKIGSTNQDVRPQDQVESTAGRSILVPVTVQAESDLTTSSFPTGETQVYHEERADHDLLAPTTPALSQETTKTTSEPATQAMAPQSIVHSTNIDVLKTEFKFPIQPLTAHSISFNLSKLPQARVQALKGTGSIIISYGLNRSRLDYNNALREQTEAPAWGHMTQLLWERDLGKQYFMSIGLAYQQLHTTFSFREDLGTYINFSERQVIKQTRRVFHNNYLELLSLQVGAGRNFPLGPQLKSQVILHFSPTYRLAQQGRTIDDNESVIDLDDTTLTSDKLLWNANASWRLAYQLPNIDLFVGAMFTQSVTKARLLSDQEKMIKPRALSFIIGIQRSW